MFKKVTILILIVIILAAGYWYYKTNIQGITLIGKILRNPQAYEGKILNLKGKVTEKVSFMTIKYFKLKDRTGEIMVITESALPPVGKKITVKGTVDSAFSIGGEQMLVFKKSGVISPGK